LVAYKTYFAASVIGKYRKSATLGVKISGADEGEGYMSDMDFAALLCSRLCHDLVSPVGAINNGLEILEEENDASMREAVLDLISKSTRQTANKLQFFRLAFGAAGGFSSELDMREAEKSVSALLDGSRVSLDWQVDAQNGSKSVVKLLLNMCLVTSESLIRGGTLTVRVKNAGESLILVTEAKGDRIIMQDIVKETLRGAVAQDQLEPRNAPAFLAASVAKELGGAILVEGDAETGLKVKATINSNN
jgi:histidine phosphotransferase ChpT